MMTLFWFLAGLATCIGVARYNEDDALFWKLFISFIGAFTAATVVDMAMDRKQEQGKVVMIDNMPTQVLESTSCCPLYSTLAGVSLSATKREKSTKPVSKDVVINSNDSTLSKAVHTSARGQPQFYMYFSDS